jgi:hypothetical protein
MIKEVSDEKSANKMLYSEDFPERINKVLEASTIKTLSEDPPNNVLKMIEDDLYDHVEELE